MQFNKLAKTSNVAIVERAIEDILTLGSETVSIIGNRELVSELLKHAMCYDHTELGICLIMEDSEYEEEYILTIYDDWTVECYPMRRIDGGEYLSFASDITYIDGSCNVECIINNEDCGELYMF